MSINTSADASVGGPLRPLAMATEEDLATALPRALRALDMLWHLFERARASAPLRPAVPAASGDDTDGLNRSFFFSYWLPVLTGLSANASHPIRAIRLRALVLLQRLLIVPELATLPPAELAVCFNEVTMPRVGARVGSWGRRFCDSPCAAASPPWPPLFVHKSALGRRHVMASDRCLVCQGPGRGDDRGGQVVFPLLEDLLLPEPFQRDVRSAEEARLKAASLLCKLFLQSLDRLQGWPSFSFLWLRILDFVSKYIRADGSETLVRCHGAGHCGGL